MQLTIIREKKSSKDSSANNLLRFAFCSEPFASIAFSCPNFESRRNKKPLEIHDYFHAGSRNETIAIPQDWAGQIAKDKSNIIYYKEKLSIPSRAVSRLKTKQWFTVSNGRFSTQIDRQLLHKVLGQLQADVVAINVSPQLQAGCEKVLINSQGKLVGFRRLYNDLTQPVPIPDDWPHHLFIKADILNKLLVDDMLPLSFTKFINNCFSNSLTVYSLNIGGIVLDLCTEEGLLGLFSNRLNSLAKNHRHYTNNKYQQKLLAKDGIEICPNARLFGKVLFGQNISISQNVTIVGPTTIGNNVKIAKGAVIRASIIGPGVSVPQNSIIQNRVLVDEQPCQKSTKPAKTNHIPAVANGRIIYQNHCVNNFRSWPRFSYTGCFKRLADIIAAVIVLILFAPIVPFIAVATKLSSPGSIFFKDKRQGRHGKTFNCLKFRTMTVGADKIQDKLRALNLVDGPQFKMEDDPRLNAVGNFLRETYIDEIPQFLNVLLGQMSVIGPRPSPESENTLCPSWRDARLSVRPGITGLWQVRRTRQPMKDFQEWIYYDTKYVRELSLRMDLLICWQTIKKLVKNFVSQF